MNPWHNVKKDRITPTRFDACIEISKGCKNKYELDKESGLLRLDRTLYTSTNYPQNYGFIPLTLSDDGDPLDVLVLCSSDPILPMSLVECTPIGVLIMIDNGLPDEKIIAVAVNDPFYSSYQDITDIPEHIMQEIKHFFTVYKTLEGKKTAVDVVSGREEAIKTIIECMREYKETIEPKVKAERGY